MALRLPLTMLLASAPLAAQDYSPDLPRIEALVAQVEAGDDRARPQLEREGRRLFTWAAQRRITGSTAHLVARVGFAAAPPLTAPDSSIPQREVFWRSGIVGALRHALAADSGDLVAAEMLLRIAPYPHTWIEPERELDHLRALFARHGYLPTPVGLAYAGLELERGDPERAQLMLLLLDRDSVGQSRWSHLDAQAHYARGSPYGQRRYYDGAYLIQDSAAAAVYRQDLEWIAEPHELAEWDRLKPGDTTHAQWLRKFWTRRDLEDSRLPGTRLREHFQRWRAALKDYRWDREGIRLAGRASAPKMGLEYNELTDIKYPRSEFVPSEIAYAGRYRPRSLIIDDLGAAIMRHGLPDQDAVLPGITAQGQRMVVWRKSSGPLVMSFSRPAISLVVTQPSELWGLIARNMPVGDLMSGCRVDAELCVLAGLVDAEADTRMPSLRAQQRYDEMRRTAEITEANPERFAKPLEAYVQTYGVAGGGVLVSYAIRARDLEGGRSKVRVVVGDLAAAEIVATLDTTRRWTIPANSDALVSGWLMLPTPPGSWRVGVVLSDSAGSRGHGTSFDNVPAIPTLVADGLRLSDPILGRENSGLRWTRMGRSIPLNPTGAWLRSEEGVLSAEVHGLVPGRNYRLAIELREGREADAPARLVITETLGADAAMMLVQRNLSFANLDAGTYRLVIRITDPGNGESVERERLVPVR